MATAMKKCAKIWLRNFTAKRIFLQPHFTAQSVNQNRDYTDSMGRETNPEKGRNKGSTVSYCEMLTRKRKEAEKSVIVAFSRGSSVEDMFKSMQEIGGKIINSIYYKAREQRYILFEFEDKQSIEAFQEDQIDLYRILQYHGQRKKVNKRKYMPEFVSKDSLMNVVFDINTLDNAKTLSGQIDMLQYYCCMREHEKRLQFFVSHQVEEVIRRLYPGALVLPFGSSATGFGLADGSDLDMAMFIDRGREQKFLTENLSYLADCRIDNTVLYLKKGGNLLSLAAGIEDVKFILRARVPIIGFRHSYTGLDCDISCNERAGVRTARILYTMAQCTGRFHPLITVVKTWGQVNRISRKGLGGGLSNFMLTMLVVHFLQSRSPPVLPAIKDMYIHDISDTEISRLSTSLEETFLKDVTEIPKPQNRETTAKTNLPHFTGRKAKSLEATYILKTHVQGVINHGQNRFFPFIDINEYCHDANLVVNTVLKVLKESIGKKGTLPGTFYIQADNCFRENKNKYVLAFCELLIRMKIFAEVHLSFLYVGHTHEDIDAQFSHLAGILKTNDAVTLPRLLALFPNAVQLRGLYNFKEWVEPYLNEIQHHSKPLHFLFRKARDEDVEVCYKGQNNAAWLLLPTSILTGIPEGRPAILKPESMHKIDSKLLQKTIEKCCHLFQEPSSKTWWTGYINEIENVNTDQTSMNAYAEVNAEWVMEVLPKQKPQDTNDKTVPDKILEMLDQEMDVPNVTIKNRTRRGTNQRTTQK